MWALGVNLNDILIPHLKKAFRLTDLQSSLIQSAFFGGYFLSALPAGWLLEKIGYKRGILAGLLTCAFGAFLFIPAASVRVYGFFLFALFVMACGQGVLEVAANPYVTILGPAESSERRLNFAQSFNAVGALVTPIIGKAFILSGIEYTVAQLAAMTTDQIDAYSALEASRVKGPYLGITAIFLLVAALIYFAKLPEIKEAGESLPADADVIAGREGSACRQHLAREASDQRSAGAVFLCRRAGGRDEFRDSVCAVCAAGDAGEGRVGLSEMAFAGIHDRAICGIGDDEKYCAESSCWRYLRRVRLFAARWRLQ